LKRVDVFFLRLDTKAGEDVCLEDSHDFSPCSLKLGRQGIDACPLEFGSVSLAHQVHWGKKGFSYSFCFNDELLGLNDSPVDWFIISRPQDTSSFSMAFRRRAVQDGKPWQGLCKDLW
jgi:hypothetical protein